GLDPVEQVEEHLRHLLARRAVDEGGVEDLPDRRFVAELARELVEDDLRRAEVRLEAGAHLVALLGRRVREDQPARELVQHLEGPYCLLLDEERPLEALENLVLFAHVSPFPETLAPSSARASPASSPSSSSPRT